MRSKLGTAHRSRHIDHTPSLLCCSLFFICEEYIPELLLVKMTDFHLSEDELADIRESFEQVNSASVRDLKSNWFGMFTL